MDKKEMDSVTLSARHNVIRTLSTDARYRHYRRATLAAALWVGAVLFLYMGSAMDSPYHLWLAVGCILAGTIIYCISHLLYHHQLRRITNFWMEGNL